MQTECQTVNVGAIIRDDTEGEDDEAEFPKGAERWEEHGGEESSDARISVTVGVGLIRNRSGRDGQTEHFGEAEGEDETAPRPGESLDARHSAGLINGVIRRIARPARAEAKHRCREREYTPRLGAAAVHVQVAELAAVGEFPQDDEEDYERGDPGVEFVGVYHFVPEDRHEPGRCGDYDYAGVAGDVGVDGVD